MLVEVEVSQCLQDIINEKCVLTQSQINGELKRRLPAKRLIHDRTVARNLEGMLFRVKLHTDYVTFLFEKIFLRKECKEHSIVCITALVIIDKIVLVVHWCY